MNFIKSELGHRDLLTRTQSARFNPLQYFLYATQIAVVLEEYTRLAKGRGTTS